MCDACHIVVRSEIIWYSGESAETPVEMEIVFTDYDTRDAWVIR